VLTARSPAESGDRRLTVVAYDPGQVFGTGLAKDLPFPLRVAWSLLGSPVLRWPLGRLDPHLNSRVAAGNALADLALGIATPPDGHVYAALRRARLTWPQPSERARSDELARALWEDSARLVRLRDRTVNERVFRRNKKPGNMNGQFLETWRCGHFLRLSQ
jgi:hypothetical protein